MGKISFLECKSQDHFCIFIQKKEFLTVVKKEKSLTLMMIQISQTNIEANAIRFKLQKLSTFSLFFTFSVHFIANFFKLIELKKNYKTLEK